VDALALARWQFGITTVYHFMFVPLTIGLGRDRPSAQSVIPRVGRTTVMNR